MHACTHVRTRTNTRTHIYRMNAPLMFSTRSQPVMLTQRLGQGVGRKHWHYLHHSMLFWRERCVRDRLRRSLAHHMTRTQETMAALRCMFTWVQNSRENTRIRMDAVKVVARVRVVRLRRGVVRWRNRVVFDKVTTKRSQRVCFWALVRVQGALMASAVAGWAAVARLATGYRSISANRISEVSCSQTSHATYSYAIVSASVHVRVRLCSCGSISRLVGPRVWGCAVQNFVTFFSLSTFAQSEGTRKAALIVKADSLQSSLTQEALQLCAP